MTDRKTRRCRLPFYIMEEDCRVYLIGDSLYTETLAQMLADAENVQVMGTAVFQTLDVTAVTQLHPQVIIIANTGRNQGTPSIILSNFPDIPIINADLNNDYVQIITSRRVSARRTDLLAAIKELAKQVGD